MSSANMTMVLIAGEQSSDEYGAKLIHSIRQAFPQVHIAVIGGTSMEKAADECIANITHHSPVGIVEQVWHRRKYHRVLDALERYCESNRIHRVLIMDFPHYHHKVAKIIQPYSIPIYTFITPHFWIWKDKKMAKTIADYSQKIFTIFEEEYELYRSLHPQTFFLGHPLLENLSIEATTQYPNAIRPPVRLGIIPGSRLQEIRYLLPSMLKVAERFSKDQRTEIVISVADERLLPTIKAQVEKYDSLAVSYFDGPLDLCLQDLHIAMVCAGSATLATVAQDRPAIVLGRISWLSYFISYFLLGIRPPFIAIPNIMTGHLLLPEHKQFISIKKVYSDLKSIVDNPRIRDKMLRNFRLFRERFSVDTPIFDRIADGLKTLEEPSND